MAAEHNAIIHLLATLLLILHVCISPVSVTDAIILVFRTASVWAAELFNTDTEKMMDVVSVEKSQAIKFIKDVSAAAVLITAAAAFCAGCMIFIPKITAVW